jgi:hypothetical protein
MTEGIITKVLVIEDDDRIRRCWSTSCFPVSTALRASDNCDATDDVPIVVISARDDTHDIVARAGDRRG